MTKDDTMTRSKNGHSPTPPQPAQQVAATDREIAAPKSRMHQLTIEEAKAWANSKGLQPPR